MGEVYRAKDPRLSREVAIKVLPPELSSDAARLKRFEKEARAASALSHPNIVTIYEIGTADATAYIAMERVEGTTLRELLASGPLPARKFLQVSTQIAEGLATAHESGIVHRDLKPENVMVTKDGLVKILDFGLAKLTSLTSGSDEGTQLPTMTGTAPGTVVGTVGYMSPEQASGEAVDFRSDQFSFGSILYEMASGQRAFYRKTAVDTLAAILNEEPPPIGAVAPQTPQPVRWILERCLAKEPAERYGATRDLARELATLLTHLSDLASFPDLGLRVARPGARRFLPAFIALAAVAAGALLGRALWRVPAPSYPTFQTLTFGDHGIWSARFAPDGQTVVYGLIREDGPIELFSTRVGTVDSRPLGLQADIAAISAAGRMAVVLLTAGRKPGTLAEAPLEGGAPSEILKNVFWADWDPKGDGLAVVCGVGGKARLEYPIGKVLFESDDFIGPPRFSRDGTRILFTNAGAFRVADLAEKKVKVLPNPTRLTEGYAWSPDGREIWVSSRSGATTEVRAFPPGGKDRVIATLPGDFGIHDVSPNGRIVGEIAADRVEMFGRAPGANRETNLAWLDGSVVGDISPDGKTVLFTETGNATSGVETVYLRGTDGSPARRVAEGYALALSPDGKWILAQRGAQTVVLGSESGEVRALSGDGVTFPLGSLFFPDGKRLLLSGNQSGVDRLYVRDIEGGPLRAVSQERVTLPQGSHALSPDGRAVAALDQAGRVWGIYALDEEPPGPPRKIKGLSRDEKPIRWSPDGAFLYVLAPDGEVSRLDPVSGRRELVWAFHPGSRVEVTPDGAAYVYGYGRTHANLLLIDGVMPRSGAAK